MKKIAYIIISITFFACQSSQPDFERSEIIVNNQRFEILTAYKIYENYIDNENNYSRNIFKRIENEFGNNVEYPFLFDALKKEIKPDENLKEELKILKSNDFRQILYSACKIITEALPGPDTKILFLPSNPEYREMFKKYGTGTHAITVGTGNIIITIDPTFSNWQKLLLYALAHEYHHSVWTSRNFKTSDFTPLEYIIFEGKAESFAMGLFPNANHPFLNMLSKSEEKRIWNLIKPELNKRKSITNDKIFYGTNEIPYGSVYAIGYSIVESFKENNPEIKDNELIDISPERILLLSNIDK
jgi:uncharacterized protein YjaZ